MILHSIWDLINNHFHVHIAGSNFILILVFFLSVAYSITMFLLFVISCNLMLGLALGFTLLFNIRGLFAVLILVSRHHGGICGFVLSIFIWRRIRIFLGILLVGYRDLMIHATFLTFFFYVAPNLQDSFLNSPIL